MSNTAKPTALQTDLESATQSLESFLTPQEDKVEETANEEVDVIEDDTYEEEAEEIEEAAESEEEIEYDEEIEDDEQLEIEEEQEQPTLYTIRVDGEEVEVTLEELQNGYSRQQDYTRKTQDLSQQRKTLETKEKEIAERDAIYAQLLPKMEAQIQGEMANEPDWTQLYEDDPVGYVREKQIWDDRKERLAAAQAEQQRLQQEAFAKQQEQYAQMVQEGQQKLLELIPEWQNPETAQQEKSAIREYGINVLGYSPQEMDTVYDYRALLGLRNAWLNSKTVEAVKKKPTQKAKARVARPGTTNRPKSVTPVGKARERLAKTGKTSDAAEVFKQLLK